MTSLRETAEKLALKYGPGANTSQYNGIDMMNEITAALEQAERAGFDRGIEDAAKLVQSHGRYTLSGFIVSGTDLPKDIRALKDVKP